MSLIQKMFSSSSTSLSTNSGSSGTAAKNLVSSEKKRLSVNLSSFAADSTPTTSIPVPKNSLISSVREVEGRNRSSSVSLSTSVPTKSSNLLPSPKFLEEIQPNLKANSAPVSPHHDSFQPSSRSNSSPRSSLSNSASLSIERNLSPRAIAFEATTKRSSLSQPTTPLRNSLSDSRPKPVGPRHTSSLNEEIDSDLTKSDSSPFSSPRLQRPVDSLRRPKKSLSELVLSRITIKKKNSLESNLHFVDEYGIPYIISDAVDYLLRTDLCSEGLFRISGNKQIESQIVQEYKAAQHRDHLKVSLKGCDEHTIANVLKTVLREHPEPLLCYHLYQRFMETAEMEDQTERLKTVASLLDQLPPSHLATLAVILDLLVKVEEHKEVNKMTAENLGTCFGPSFLRPIEPLPSHLLLTFTQKAAKIVEHLILNFNLLFINQL